MFKTSKYLLLYYIKRQNNNNILNVRYIFMS